jgi:type IV pilus assembly protein PilF
MQMQQANLEHRYAGTGRCGAPVSRRMRWTVGAAAIALPLVLACGPKRGAHAMTAADPERQSEAEFDVARDLFMARHDARGAIGHSLKALELNSENAEAAHLTALIYLYFCATSPVDCHFDQAEKYARLAVKNKENFREAQNTLGVVLVHEKRYADAIQVFEPLTRDIQYSTPETAWGNLGWAYLLAGQADRAIEALRQAVALQPDFCVGNYRLGLAYERKNDLKAARDVLSRAVETDRPECRGLQDAFGARARVQVRLGDPDGARSDLERCRELGADTPMGRECTAMTAKLK